MPRRAIPAVVVALALLVGLDSAARAGTRRIAVVVGNNVGHGDDRPLRYAEQDATRVAALLRELGRFDDLTVLLGRDAAAVLASLAAVRLRASAYRAAGDQVLFAFYYSGHGSGDGLHLGASRLGFAALQGEMDAHVALGVRLVDRKGWVDEGFMASRHGSLSLGVRLRF